MSHVEPQAVMDKLAGLGSSAAIAEFLRAEDIRGNHHSASCPVAQYLKREAGWRVSVSFKSWSLRARELPAGMRRRNRTPKPIEEFIHEFDAGAYPELDWAAPVAAPQ